MQVISGRDGARRRQASTTEESRPPESRSEIREWREAQAATQDLTVVRARETAVAMSSIGQVTAVLAMSQQHLHQSQEARAALKKSADLAQAQLPKLEDGDLGRDWRDWIIAHALQSEAKQMINGESSRAQPASSRE